jgi:DNA-binding HxlR family transcriptional regulator
MATPLPKRRVRGSATGRPIMALLDLLGRRMAGRILWELRDGSFTFRSLQEAAGTNPSVLNIRLRELREARLVEHGPEGYGLTPHGKELLRLFLPLHVWAEDWARQFEPSGAKRRIPSPRRATSARTGRGLG